MNERPPGPEAQDSPPPSGEESDLPLDEAAESLPDGYLTIGSPLERLVGAEAAYRRGDERGDGVAASVLGLLLERRGDLAGAEAAYRRGDERGDGSAANNLGGLPGRRGDLVGAEAAYRRGDERGDGVAARNLGILLGRRGDLAGAEAAYLPGEAKRRPVWGYFVVAGLLALAFVWAVVNQGSEPTCGMETMHPGDECLVYGRNDSSTSTYEEAKRAKEQAPTWLGVAAAVFALIGCVVGATRKPLSPQARKAPDPHAERHAWETALAQQKDRAIERYLTTIPPEKREKERAAFERSFARMAARERRKRGWTGSG